MAKFSIRKVNDKQIVLIENSTLTNKQLNDYKVVTAYIAQHIGEVYTIIEDQSKVYMGEDFPGEYTHSNYTTYLRNRKPGLLKAKNKAIEGLGQIIETATDGKPEKTKHPESKDAKYGMYRYNISFAFRVKKTGEETQTFRSYDAELLIRHASDGKKYLYDIVKIKENTDDVIDLQKKETRLAAMNAASQSSVSDDIVQQNSTDVNRESKKSIRGGSKELDRAALLRQNQELKERVEELKWETRLTKKATTDRKAVRKAAEEIPDFVSVV